mmetsp:Transcript_29001/g.57973  ORF Transcript_29001/g.57973 Transcript_29001/m.57973 type:complete len:203 (+) Transcript_29001:447-1055(+)
MAGGQHDEVGDTEGVQLLRALLLLRALRSHGAPAPVRLGEVSSLRLPLLRNASEGWGSPDHRWLAAGRGAPPAGGCAAPPPATDAPASSVRARVHGSDRSFASHDPRGLCPSERLQVLLRRRRLVDAPGPRRPRRGGVGCVRERRYVRRRACLRRHGRRRVDTERRQGDGGRPVTGRVDEGGCKKVLSSNKWEQNKRSNPFK